jgi:hypothetical protein
MNANVAIEVDEVQCCIRVQNQNEIKNKEDETDCNNNIILLPLWKKIFCFFCLTCKHK